MNESELQRLIKSLETAPLEADRLVAQLPDEELRRKPAEEEFSALEHICHLGDIEREGYAVRIRRLLEEDLPFLHDIDGDSLAKERAYNEQELRPAIEAFALARRDSLRRLEGLSHASLSREGHLENVGRITLGGLLSMMMEHDREHLLKLSGLRDRLLK